MPLQSKQQPPYYTPGTTTGPAIQQKHIQLTPIESITTTVTSAAIYTMPANTMTTNGDILIIDYFGNSYNNPSVACLIKLQMFGGAPILLYAATGNKNWRIQIQIVRSTTTIAYYSAIASIDGANSFVTNGSVTADFTINNLTELTIQAPTDGNIRCSAGYTQLIKS